MRFKRWIAGLLCICMVLGMNGMTSHAEEVQDAVTTISGNEVQENNEPTISGNTTISDNIISEPVEPFETKKLMSTVSVPETGGETTVTRVQWLHALTTVFNMTVEEDNYPDNYFSDMDASSEYYYDIMLATEFGLIDVEAGDAICPNDPATREFAAHTLNLCLGYVMEEGAEYTYRESKDVTYPEDIQIAIDRGWFTLTDSAFLPDKAITEAEKTAMIDYAAEAIASTVIDEGHKNEYTFLDDVIVLPDNVMAELTNDNEITITDCPVTLSVGDKFALIQDDFPVVKKVAEISVVENRTVIKVESVPMDEAFKSYDLQGSIETDLSQVKTSNNNVSLKYIVGGTLENEWEDGKKYEDVDQVGIQKVNAIEVQAQYDIPKRIQKKYNLSDGMTANITCTISNFMPNYDSTWNTAYFSLSAVATFSCNVNLDVLAEIGVAPSIELVRIPIACVGYFKVNLDMVLQGNATLNFVEFISIGVYYKHGDGFRLERNFYKESFTIQAQAEAKIGIKVSAGVDCGFIKGEVYGKVGAAASIETETYTDEELPKSCTHVSAYLYASVGYKVKIDILVAKKEWGDDFTIFKSNNSPVRVAFHYEDGAPVIKCTRDLKEETGSGTGKKRWKYYTPADSRYGYNGSNSGVDSGGNEYTIFNYSLDEDGNATITSYNGNVSAINIPETLDGHPVVGIGEFAFKDNQKLHLVVIPDSVLKIGEGAFGRCTNLSNITLSHSLQQMGAHAFFGCNSLTSIEIPKSLKSTYTAYIYEFAYDYQYGPFYSCDNLKTITFEEGTTTIAKGLFAHCSGLEKVIIPDTVTSIGVNAFEKCENLKTVCFSDAISSIGEYSFYQCSKLENVDLPKSLQYIGCLAFGDCDSLCSIEIPKTMKQVGVTSIWLGGGPNYRDGGPFTYCNNLHTVSFENGTKTITENIFTWCVGVKEVIIPETVTKIDNNAFLNCYYLEDVVIPDSVTYIGSCVFSNCIRLVNVILPKYIKVIGYQAFGNCDSLTNIVIPKSLDDTTFSYNSNIPEGVFYGCDSLETVILEDGMTKIVNYLFADCTGLAKIVIPNTVTKIETSSFENCPALEAVEMSNALLEISTSAFNGCKKLSEVTIPNSVKTIGYSAFSSCTSLKKVVIPEGVTSIESYAFNGCSSLEDAILPNSLTNMGNYIFAGCTSLEKVTLPNGRKNITSGTFQGCRSLKYIELPESVTYIREYAFQNAGLMEITLPPNLIQIEKYAFQNCDALTAITLPDSLTSIGTYAFADCEVLADVKLGTGLTTIPAYAFNLCPEITKIVLPYRIKSVASNAFTNCTSLKEIVIPRATTSIGNNAFSYPTKMTVYGISGTYAETWAAEVGATFVNQEVNATAVTLNATELTLNKGTKEALILSVTPADFTDEVVWRTSDEEVATISDAGVVTAKAVGTATIRVTVGEVSASCKVTVQQPVTNIGLNATTLSLEAFDTYSLVASVYPSSAANKEVEWSSSDETVATVDQDGLVTALTKGTATITVTARDGSDISKSCKVTVTNNGYICNQPSEMESPHNYPVNCTDSWIYTLPDAEQLYVTFDTRTVFEEDFDFLYVYTGENELVGKYTGTQLAGKTIQVPGNTVKLKLDSDGAGTAWGFKVTGISATDGPVKPAPDVYVLKPPVFNLPSESKVTAGTQIVLSCEEEGARIFYTLDGSIPTEESLLYSAPIPVTEELTIRAYAVKEGYEASAIVTAVYYLVDSEEKADTVNPEDIPEGGIPEGMWIAEIDPQLYTGQAVKPEVRVYDGEKKLKAGKDYTVSYKNNKKANDASNSRTAPTVTVKGKGNYTGTAAANFVILPVDLESDSIEVTGLTLAYNKKIQKKIPIITFKGKKLSSKADFTVVYVSKENGAYCVPGTYEVEIQGKGNFCGKTRTTIEITESVLISKTKITKVPNQPYRDGEPVEPELEIVYRKNQPALVKNVDYTVTYRNNCEIGTAQAVITGLGKYAGTRTVNYKIVGTSLKGATVTGITDCVYDGTEKQQDIQVVYNGQKLAKDTHYEVLYDKNIEVGTAKVIIQGKGAYTGTIKKSFKIKAYNLEEDSQNLITGLENRITAKYVKGGVKPQFELYFAGRGLVRGRDYTVIYRNNKAVAEEDAAKAPAIIIKGKGNYKGTITKFFTIEPKNLQDQESPVHVVLQDVAAVNRRGKYKSKPVLTDADGKKLVAGIDYEKAICYKLEGGTVLDGKSIVPKNTDVFITIVGKGNYYGTYEAAYRVTEKSFSKAKITIEMKPTYSGQVICLDSDDITVKLGKEYLVYGRDYEIVADSYQHNVEKGTASVVVKGLGIYGGSKTVKFTIQPKRIQW